MTNKIAIVLFLITIILLYSCNSKNSNVISEQDTANISGPPAPCEDRSTPLNIVNNSDTLKISILTSDCGEWGGHKEYVYLYRNKDYKILARFIQDSVSCKNMTETNGFGHVDYSKSVKIFDTCLILSKDGEKLLNEFLRRLFELYLRREVHGNSGYSFQVMNTDSTLNFTYWNSGDCRNTYYGNIRNQIFGRKNKLKR
jgi:hypothetical protein